MLFLICLHGGTGYAVMLEKKNENFFLESEWLCLLKAQRQIINLTNLKLDEMWINVVDFINVYNNGIDT